MTEASQQDLRRRGGRRERRDLRTRPDHAMLPSLTGRLPLTEPMDEEQIECVRLDYDINAVVQKVKAIDELSDFLGQRLLEGR